MTDAPAQHPAPLSATVADVMHPPVTAVNQNDHVAAAAYLMKRRRDRPLDLPYLAVGRADSQFAAYVHRAGRDVVDGDLRRGSRFAAGAPLPPA